MRFQIELWFARFRVKRMCAGQLFSLTQARLRVSPEKKVVCILDRVYHVGKASFSRPSSSPLFAPSSYFSRWIFADFVSWRATGYRWSVPLKQPATGFNLQVGLFRASQTRRLPALAGNSQFPANSAISCCVRPPRNVGRTVTSYFVRPSYKRSKV